jgi:DnaK suppressor protein
LDFSVAKPTKKSASRKAVKATTKKKAARRSMGRPMARTTPPRKPAKMAGKGTSKSAAAAVGSSSKAPAKLTRSSPEVKPTNGKAAKLPPAIIPPPPPPRSKPGKNQAGFSPKELEVFRDALLQKRRELVGDMRSMESEALQRSGENLSNLPLHMADMGTDNYEQEFTLGLMEKDRQLLREINTALSKIMDGRFGICEGTGKPISKARLEVQPWAKYSIEYARKLENRGVR